MLAFLTRGPGNFDQIILTNIVNANGVSHSSLWATVHCICLANRFPPNKGVEQRRGGKERRGGERRGGERRGREV